MRKKKGYAIGSASAYNLWCRTYLLSSAIHISDTLSLQLPTFKRFVKTEWVAGGGRTRPGVPLRCAPEESPEPRATRVAHRSGRKVTVSECPKVHCVTHLSCGVQKSTGSSPRIVPERCDASSCAARIYESKHVQRRDQKSQLRSTTGASEFESQRVRAVRTAVMHRDPEFKASGSIPTFKAKSSAL